MGKELIVNWFDQSVLADSFVQSIMRCGGTNPGTLRTPKKIKYVKNIMNWDGITLFTDKVFHLAPSVKSKYKVAIVIEPRELLPYIYDQIVAYEEYFDLILTYDQALLEKNPKKYVFMQPDSSTLSDEDCRIHKKNKLVSMVYSNKTQLFGHRLRHIIAKQILIKSKTSVELFGTGTDRPIKFKAEGTNDFMFQIAIENSKRKNYFADKILDCISTGTIPIYWGCDNIGDYFDQRGILSFNTPDQLIKILDSLSEEKYLSMFEYVQKNYEICLKNYLCYDDIIYEKMIKFFGEENVK